MLSKSQIRLVTSLQQKKFRKQHGAFVVEGLKSIQEFLAAEPSAQLVQQLYIVADLLAKMDKIPQNIKLIEVTEEELKKISSLNTPQGALAVLSLPNAMVPESDPSYLKELASRLAGQYTLVLDEVQDPGNLGTIIRIADWFGFGHVLCSKGSVDAYNPKTVQASMGSLSRVRVEYVDLPLFLENYWKLPVYGALLDGTSLYETDFSEQGGLVILGNEGSGISPEVAPFIQFPVTIPRVGQAESLNVAISASLFCAELRRGK